MKKTPKFVILVCFVSFASYNIGSQTIHQNYLESWLNMLILGICSQESAFTKLSQMILMPVKLDLIKSHPCH